MKLNHRGRTLRAGMRSTATPKLVYEAWTDPVKIQQWFTDRAEGVPTPGAIFTWYFDRFGYAVPLKVLAAEPEKQFALEGSKPGREPGILEITIEQEGGETKLTLVNSGFLHGAEWEEEYQGTSSGWGMALATLKQYLENYFGEPRREIFHMRPAQFTCDSLWPYYSTAEARAKWLTGVFDPAGPVLADTGREILFDWKEIRGTLGLKAFSMGPGNNMIALQSSAWSMDAQRAAELEAQMVPALDRLAALLNPQGEKA